MRLKTWAAIGAALALPLLSGCGDDNAQKGFVRVVNATTEYTSLDLSTLNSDGGNDVVVSGTAANTASAYEGIDKGSYTFNVKSSTGTSATTSVTGTVTKADHFTVVTYVTGAATKTQFLSDEEANPASGNAKLRILNAATSEAPSVDVYVTGSDCTALSVTDSAFASAVGSTVTTYSQVTPSATTPYNVCVFAAGDTSTLLLDITGLVLKNQEIATLILTHTAGGVLLNGSVLDQQGAYTAYANTIARLRVVADAEAAAAVSVTVGSTPLAVGAPSPSVGEYMTVPVGALSPTITISGTPVSGFTLPATAAGNDYTLLVTGNVGAPKATLITDVNIPSTNLTSTVRVRVINGLNNTSGAVSATIDGRPVGTASFGLASTYTNIPPSSGTSTVHVTTTGTQPADLTSKTFTAGSVYTIFVYGDASAPTIAPFADR